ncbi:DUF3240 family protein [Thiomicrorhabdus arctica]|jgi:hypothetical protein|uniref:DUF3240 family protein n=1 Tax=Thiomicrorhabdus arctica TaxID=131540 RepID=UPI00035E232B|nr:DUF3240 family protein [Thiomicrorhabdus arctica]
MYDCKDCILRLIFSHELYDEMTDVLFSFPERELEFMSLDIQAHMQSLESITEQVSGFKRRKMVEVTIEQGEAKRLHRHITQSLPQVKFQAQLLPLLTLDENL